MSQCYWGLLHFRSSSTGIQDSFTLANYQLVETTVELMLNCPNSTLPIYLIQENFHSAILSRLEVIQFRAKMEESDPDCTVPNGVFLSSLAALAVVIDRPFELFQPVDVAEKPLPPSSSCICHFWSSFFIWKCLGRSFISVGEPTEGDCTARGRTELLCIS